MISRPQATMTFGLYGNTARGEHGAVVTLEARPAGTAKWRRVGSVRSYPSNGGYLITYTPRKAGTYELRAVTSTDRSPMIVVVVQPRLRGSLTSISAWPPPKLGVNDEVFASGDLSSVVYGLAKGSYADQVIGWWRWTSETSEAVPLDIPLRNVNMCELAEDGQHFLYWHRGQLRLLNLETGEIVDVPNPDEDRYFSPSCGTMDGDAGRVAYSVGVKNSDGQEDVFVWDRSTGELAVVPRPGAFSQDSAEFVDLSSDGSSVAYLGIADCAADCSEYVATWHAGEDETHVITPFANNLRFLMSPSHRYMAYERDISQGRSQLRWSDLESGEDRLIATSPKYGPSLTPTGVSEDGGRVLLEEFDNYGDRAASLYDADTGVTTALFRYTYGRWVYPHRLSSDGKKVLLSGIKALLADEHDGIHRDAYILQLRR